MVGANLPTGYVATSLISVRRTNASGQFIVSYQYDRTVDISLVSVLSAGGATAYTSVSLTSAVPPNAKYCGATYGVSTPNASSGARVIAADTVNEVGMRLAICPVATANLGGTWSDIRLINAQSMLYKVDVSGGTLSININQYKF